MLVFRPTPCLHVCTAQRWLLRSGSAGRASPTVDAPVVLRVCLVLGVASQHDLSVQTQCCGSVPSSWSKCRQQPVTHCWLWILTINAAR